MRNEVVAQGQTITVGELRAALEGLDDAVPVWVQGVAVDKAVAEDLALHLETEPYFMGDVDV